MVGTTISHYNVLEKIGQGGMGEVHRAEDTRLGRVLDERKVRRLGETKERQVDVRIVAATNHPR